MASELSPRQKNPRRFSLAYKRQVVEETFEEGVQIASVARRHDLARSLVDKWREHYHDGKLESRKESTEPLPLQVFMPEPSSSSADSKQDAPSSDALVITLNTGHRLELRGRVDTAALRVALDMLAR